MSEGMAGGSEYLVCSDNLACFVFMKQPFWDLPFAFHRRNLKYCYEQAGIYVLKVSNRNSRTRLENMFKVYSVCYSVSAIVFLLLTLNMKLAADEQTCAISIIQDQTVQTALMMMTMTLMTVKYFYGMVDWRKMLSLISSQDDCQRDYIANLWDTARRIRACAKPGFRICWMKVCDNDISYITAPWCYALCLLPYHLACHISYMGLKFFFIPYSYLMPCL